MKIEKLYTLNQFIDIINEYELHTGNKIDAYLYIKKYNESLKHSLIDLNIEVIFNCEIIWHSYKDVGGVELDKSGDYMVKFKNGVELVKYTHNDWYYITPKRCVVSLNDLAIATDGELGLQNYNI